MDWLIFQKINQWATQWFFLDILGIFFAQYFGYCLVFLLFVFLLINWRRHWLPFIQSFLAAFLARFVFVEIIRYFWPRPRPFVTNHINLLLEKTNQASFPSGHAAFYFALSFFFFLALRKIYPQSKLWQGIGLLFLIGASLICLARVFVGVHWPSDVLVGGLLGIFSSWLINFLTLKLFRR
ncbi:MAG: phosphatase PAP2 family protein [Minisyncoccales bacterium]